MSLSKRTDNILASGKSGGHMSVRRCKSYGKSDW